MRDILAGKVPTISNRFLFLTGKADRNDHLGAIMHRKKGSSWPDYHRPSGRVYMERPQSFGPVDATGTELRRMELL